MRPLHLLLLVLIVAVGCSSPPAVEFTQTPIPESTSTSTPPAARPPALWIAPTVPQGLREAAASLRIPEVPDASAATLRLQISGEGGSNASHWVYALVAPFPTVLDGVTLDELRAHWQGAASDSFAAWPMWMSASTLSAFSELWGEPASTIHVAASDELVDSAWSSLPSWGIVPFEDLEPRWKVLTVDGQSPIHRDFDPGSYPLMIGFSLVATDGAPPAGTLPLTNRDSSKLTTVIMSGTSALVRGIAYQMEVYGLDWPAGDIGDWLRQADIVHVSNEVAFDPACPPPNPNENRFYCSDPRYIGLFDDVGVNVVELTGNHIMDQGEAALRYSLKLYREHNIGYFGGGANLEEARQPLLVEDHGNRIAFVGCNAGEPPEPFATNKLPGANPCDWPQLVAQIGQLREQGYLPIVTFQYKEGYSPMVMPWQSLDFRRAADAGAVIVSGSQSHVPLQMEFHNGTFIHYGLGNLFFDQMANQPPGPGLPLQPAERYEFLDRHVLYDGRYLGTELLTALLENYGRPRPMDAAQRSAILQAYFGYSGWLPLVPTPAPELTPTLYPLLRPVPLPTHTPFARGTPTP
ncbi:MAG: CapA family protein [Anaerolineales bacterium]